MTGEAQRALTVHCNLNRLMGQHRHKVTDVADKTGLSRNTVTQLYYDESTAIRFDTIAALCELYNCKIGDLLELIPANAENNKSK